MGKPTVQERIINMLDTYAEKTEKLSDDQLVELDEIIDRIKDIQAQRAGVNRRLIKRHFYNMRPPITNFEGAVEYIEDIEKRLIAYQVNVDAMIRIFKKGDALNIIRKSNGRSELYYSSTQLTFLQDELQDYYQHKLVPYILSLNNLAQLNNLIFSNISDVNLSRAREWLLRDVEQPDGNKRNMQDTLQMHLDDLTRKELALVPYEIEMIENPMITHGQELRTLIFKLANSSDDGDEMAQKAGIEEIKNHLLKRPTLAMDRHLKIREYLNFGGNSEGMKLWRWDLYNEWIRLEKEHPDHSAEDIHFELLNRYTDRIDNRRIPKNGLSPKDERKVASLMTRKAKETPAKYSYDLKKAGELEKTRKNTPVDSFLTG